MSFVGGDWRHDVFISYARRDNKLAAGGELGWIDEFRHRLVNEVSQMLGQDISCFFDETTSDQLVDTSFGPILKRSALFVQVLSPFYLTRPACRQEFDLFFNERTDKTSIFVAQTRAVDESQKFPGMEQLIGAIYFFTRDNDLEILLRPDSREYARMMTMLSNRIASKLKVLKSERLSSIATARDPERAFVPSQGTSILIARAEDDLSTEEMKFRTYLQQQNLIVLPESGRYSGDPGIFAEEFARDLERCDMFVQLIGPSRERIYPHEMPEGLVRFQSDAADAEASKRIAGTSKSRRKLVIERWAQARPLARTEDYAAFLESVQFKIRASIEDFKDDVVKQARAIHERRPSQPPRPDELFMCVDDRDEAEAKDLERQLRPHFQPVLRSLTQADARQQDSYLTERFQRASAILFLRCKAPPAFVQSRVSQFFNAMGKEGAPERLPRLEICHGPPPPKSDDDIGVVADGLEHVNCAEGWDIDRIVQPLRRAEGGVS